MSCKKISQLPANDWCDGILLLGEQEWALVKVPLTAECFGEWTWGNPCEVTCDTFTINGNLEVNGSADVTTLTADEIVSNGDVNVVGELNVAWDTTFSDDVTFANGTVDFSWVTVVWLWGAWLWDGLFNNIVANTLTVTWATSLDNTTVDGTFDATWDADIWGDLDVGGDLSVGWDTEFTWSVQVDSDLTVNGQTNLDDVTVCGDMNFCPWSNLDLSNVNISLPTVLVWQATQTQAWTVQLAGLTQVYTAQHVSTTWAGLITRPTLLWQAIARQHYTFLGHLWTSTWGTGDIVWRLPSNILSSTLWVPLSGDDTWLKVSFIADNAYSWVFTLSIVDENDLNEFWPYPVVYTDGTNAEIQLWEYVEAFFNTVTNKWIKLWEPPVKYFENFFNVTAWTVTFTHNFWKEARVVDLEVRAWVSPSTTSSSNGRATDKWSGLVGIGTGIYVDSTGSPATIGTNRVGRVRTPFDWWDIAINWSTINTLSLNCIDIWGNITARWFIRIST